ncbi:MAG: hypothetical protein Q4A97_05530 [Comamonadaceae bacterium]|nr:hypothetical protein [Comamonadaceae bacterium]
MLRALIVFLLLANIGYFAWVQAHRASPAPDADAASAASVRADAVALLQALPSRRPAAETQPAPALIVAQGDSQPAPAVAEPPAQPAAAAQSPEPPAEPAQEKPPEKPPERPQDKPAEPPPPKQCMALGPFSNEQMEPVRGALARWPQSYWRLTQSTQSGRWMVFWGGVADELVLSARRSELQNKGISYERLRSTSAGPGFSLGRFSTESAAEQQKRNLEQSGISGTQVLVERQPATVYTIEFPDYHAIRDVVRRDLGRHMGGRSLQPC